jgi:hypothetical protein
MNATGRQQGVRSHDDPQVTVGGGTPSHAAAHAPVPQLTVASGQVPAAHSIVHGPLPHLCLEEVARDCRESLSDLIATTRGMEVRKRLGVGPFESLRRMSARKYTQISVGDALVCGRFNVLERPDCEWGERPTREHSPPAV